MDLVNSFSTHGLCGEIKLPGHRRLLLNQTMSPSNRPVRLLRIPARCKRRVHPRVRRCAAWGFAAPDLDCATRLPSKPRSCLQVILQTCFYLRDRFLWPRQLSIVWQITDENASRDAVFFGYLACLKSRSLVLGTAGGSTSDRPRGLGANLQAAKYGLATEIAS
jgi:hypothetical protein